MSSEPAPFADCPVPLVDADRILLGHGAGGRLSAELTEKMLLPALGNPELAELDDAARLDLDGARLAFTTDSFVVTPLFFPGGDIGELAVNGTVNDLAVMGATPRALSLAFILEEGFEKSELAKIVASIARASTRAGVSIVTGDTKVVGRGAADRLYINTAGIGVLAPGIQLGSRRVQPGDAILLSGTVGDHGIAVMSRRAGLEFEGDLRSDTAPLHAICRAVCDASGSSLHAMRDPTRGGLAATLVEVATRAGVGVEVDEAAIPVGETVRGACEMLGLDPLLVANEGKVVVFVAEAAAERALTALRNDPLGTHAARIGRVVATHPKQVILRTPVGGERLLDLPWGEALPRIC
jgi:hydrogenase expression/formation protein HypE